jgi:hypothetical protein
MPTEFAVNAEPAEAARLPVPRDPEAAALRARLLEGRIELATLATATRMIYAYATAGLPYVSICRQRWFAHRATQPTGFVDRSALECLSAHPGFFKGIGVVLISSYYR